MGEFNVWQFFDNDTHEEVRHRVPAGEAVMAAHHYTHSVAAKNGFVRRVIIEDEDGYTAFEWKFGEGITFPPECVSDS